MAELAGLAKQPAVLVATGALATAAGAAGAAYRVCEKMPLVGGVLRRSRSELQLRGEQVIARGTEPVKVLVSEIALEIVRLVLQQLDLTQLVREEVDIDAIVADV